jgi:hypothetical protein
VTFPPHGGAQRAATAPVPPQVYWAEQVAAPPRPRPGWVWPTSFGVALLVACALLAVLLLQSPGASAAASPATTTAGNAGKSERLTPDTGWQDVTLVGGWVATGDGARYRVRDGVCYLQLHVTLAGGVWDPNTPMATLPVSARPAWHMGFVGTRDGLPFGEVKVFHDGRVFVVAASTAPGGDITVSAAFPVGS